MYMYENNEIEQINGNNFTESNNQELTRLEIWNKIKIPTQGKIIDSKEGINMRIFCICGCGQQFEENDKYGRKRKYILGHQNLGKHYSEEHRKKISESQKGKKISKETRIKISKKLKKLYKEGKIVNWNKGKKGISIAWNKGKKYSKEYRQKLSEAHKGYKMPEEQKKKIGLANKGGNKGSFKRGLIYPWSFKSGDEHPYWNNGSSFEPYDSKWNNNLKKKVRERDNFICQSCGITQQKFGRTLHVHHIDINKKNNNIENLISLCTPCHAKITFSKKGALTCN